MIPLLETLRGYRREDAVADGLAGLTTAIMLVPQAMAYAMLAGLEPIVGLYASTVPLVLYALVGSSRPLAVGPVAMDSLMVAAALAPLALDAPGYAAAAAFLALLVGAVQLGAGVLRLGWLAAILSRPVLLGFTAAAALLIGLSQLGSATGMALPRSQQAHRVLLAAFAHLPELSVVTTAMTAASVAALFALKARAPRFPRFLAVVVVATVLTWGLGLPVAVVGEVPAGLPSPSIPQVDPAAIPSLLGAALAIAAVALMESLSVASRYGAVQPNRELVGLGMANIGAGVIGGYPVTGGFSRTAVNAEAGARTPLAGVVTAGIVALTLLLLTDAFTFLPRAALAAIILSAVVGLVDLAGLRALDRPGRVLALLTFVATATLGIQPGIAIGIGASLVWRALTYRRRPSLPAPQPGAEQSPADAPPPSTSRRAS